MAPLAGERRGGGRGRPRDCRHGAFPQTAVAVPHRGVLGGGARCRGPPFRFATCVGRRLSAPVAMEVCVRNRILLCAIWAATGAIVILAIGALTGTPIELTAQGTQHGAGGM